MATSFSYQEFNQLHRFIRKCAENNSLEKYWVPEFLVGGTSPNKLVNVGQPYKFYLQIFDEIQTHKNNIESNQFSSISQNDCIYQSFIRTFASLNGEIGTALKQIAFLPFLKKYLGISVFLSLPTGVIGGTNRKGKRGSPFAIKNPFDIDSSFGDPLLPGFSPLFQYKVLIQACRKLGIRSGSIVPLATLSLDSPLFKYLPGIGFWWAADPQELLYCEDQSDDLLENNLNDDFNPPQISNIDKTRFLPAPLPENVRSKIIGEHLHYIAEVEHQGHKLSATLANAFPDVVAGDSETYTWGDVTPIKYINQVFPPPMGIRCSEKYDPALPAWQIMPYLIAWRAHVLGEEVFLVDVNQSVPEKILMRSQQIYENWDAKYEDLINRIFSSQEDSIILSELTELLDFDYKLSTSEEYTSTPKLQYISEELWSFNSDSDLIKTVVGPLIFCVSAHTRNHEVFLESLRNHLQELGKNLPANLYTAGVSNHDTMPPIPWLSSLLFSTYYFLPNSIPLIFSGTEFYAQSITNKEFGFNTSEYLLQLRQELDDNRLGLFNDFPLDWSNLPIINFDDENQLMPFQLLNILGSFRKLLLDIEDLGFIYIQIPKSNCFGYIRSPNLSPNDSFILLANWDLSNSVTFSWPYDEAKMILSLQKNKITTKQKIFVPKNNITLAPLSTLIFVTGTFHEKFS